MNEIINGLINFANSVIDVITSILPGSPFAAYLEFSQSVPWLKMLNYFVPIGAYVSITTSWATILLIYYGKSVVLKWIKVVKG